MPGSTTFFGWPFPVNSDPIAQGADTIGAAITGIENSMVVAGNSKTAASLLPEFPLGRSQMLVNSSGAATWPLQSTGIVWTMRRGDNQGFQYFYAASSVRVWIRYGSATAWTNWFVVAGPDIGVAVASGSITATPLVANQATLIPVTFPADRFTQTTTVGIRVWAQATGTVQPNQVMWTCRDTTSSGFNLNVWSAGPTQASFWWFANQGAS